MNHKLTLVLLGAAVALPAFGQAPAAPAAAAPAVAITATGTLVTQYMFRGQRLNAGGFQPTIEAAAGDFTAGVSGKNAGEFVARVLFTQIGQFFTKNHIVVVRCVMDVFHIGEAFLGIQASQHTHDGRDATACCDEKRFDGLRIWYVKIALGYANRDVIAHLEFADNVVRHKSTRYRFDGDGKAAVRPFRR